jgi:AhpD family alkylhydroperoxidase
MEPRLDYMQASPAAVDAMLSLESYLADCGLEPSLVHLVKMRASQINGCAYCLDMHSKDARANGETEQRLYLLDGWRETPFFSARERAALAWTDAVTLISATHAPDDVYRVAHEQFSERELMDLTLAVVAINGWNRICIAFRVEPGAYRPLERNRGPGRNH